MTCRTFLYDFKRKKSGLCTKKRRKKTPWGAFWLARL